MIGTSFISVRLFVLKQTGMFRFLLLLLTYCTFQTNQRNLLVSRKLRVLSRKLNLLQLLNNTITRNIYNQAKMFLLVNATILRFKHCFLNLLNWTHHNLDKINQALEFIQFICSACVNIGLGSLSCSLWNRFVLKNFCNFLAYEFI